MRNWEGSDSSTVLKSTAFILLSKDSKEELESLLQTKAKNLCRGIPFSQSRNGLPFRVNGRAGILLVSIPSLPLKRPTSTLKIRHESPLTPFNL